MPREADLWTETLIVMLIIAAMLVISWSFKQRRETFVTDTKPAEAHDYSIFFSIVDSYKKILDRPPSEAEIQMAKGRLSTDMQYDIIKLEAGLRQSAEYRRLVALQRNTVHADLEGVVSDRQTIEMVKARYTKINGSPPDEDTLKFLLERYRKSKLDDVYLEALIQNISTVPMSHVTGMYVGPDGPGSPKTKGNGKVSNDANRISQTDAGAAQRLYDILGLDKETIKGILEGDDATTKKLLEEARLRKQADGKSMCAVDPMLANMTPEQVEQYVKTGAQKKLKQAACNYAKVTRAQELADANMKPGRPIGSWTMPERARAPVCIGTGVSNPVALSGQTALIGTLLNDNVPQHPDMLLQLR